MNLQQPFIEKLKETLPGLSDKIGPDLVSANLLSPFTVELPKSLLKQSQDIVRDIFTMRETPEYQKHYAALTESKGLKDPGNKSIMMSYDFHVDPQGQLKLIEVNTNASFLILGHQMYQVRKEPLPVSDFSLNEIKEDILKELHLAGKALSRPPKVAIIDDKPTEQRLYVEFLAYAELFKSWGWEVLISDFREVLNFAPDFIYNRHTDFFLAEPESAALREAYLKKEVCFSPQPYEYLMLADKQRLIDWREPGFLDNLPLSAEQRSVIEKATPLSFDLNAENAVQIWSERKKFFFKPKNAFGSKLSYRGSSISRKAFDEIVGTQTIAQEYVPAPELTFETPDGPKEFKFDLRCYAYQGRMQLMLARLYQGQVTNLRTPWGGFAPVKFI